MDQDYITEDTLKEHGITLEGEDQASLLAHLNETLEERVGLLIAESLDDQQLTSLINLQETGSDDEVSQWLADNVPALPEIVKSQIDILLSELADNASDINAAA